MTKKSVPTTPAIPSPRPAESWSSAKKAIVSLVLAFHVLAVFLGPFAFATQSGPGISSPVAEALMRPMQWYIDLAFLNHGYFFFAPNPGPSCIVRYQVEFADGRPAVEGRFPDRTVHKPRLFYHRHFMLSEQWNGMFLPKEPPPEVAADPERLSAWKSQRTLFELQKRSFEQHLSATNGGGRATVIRVEHRPASVPEVMREHRSLQDPSTYQDLSDDAPAQLPPLRPY